MHKVTFQRIIKLSDDGKGQGEREREKVSGCLEAKALYKNKRGDHKKQKTMATIKADKKYEVMNNQMRWKIFKRNLSCKNP